MNDPAIFLIVIGVVLTVVTLVGHGIWVFLAWLLRVIGSSALPSDSTRSTSPFRDAQDQAATGTSCPRCSCSLSMYTGECVVCDWPGPLPASSRHGAVGAELETRLARLEKLGKIDAKARRELSAAIKAWLVDTAPPAAVPTTNAPPIETADAGVVESGIDEPAAETVPPAKPPATSPAERARRYAAARARADAGPAAADVPVTEAGIPQSEPAPPRREMLELLAAFMQERNIRWGELVGGLLIVGCSIALAISFWAQIAERQLLKFVIFNGVSAALFGAGFYTLRRWQIQTTSRGLLIIATLLVPLNFLAIAALTQQASPTDLFSISGELISLAMFTALTYMASRTLVPGGPLLLVTSVMLTSLMQLVMRRFGGEEMASLGVLYILAAVPIVCYAVVTGLAVARVWRRDDAMAEDDGWNDARLYTLLGVASYATLLPLGLLIFQSGTIVDTLSRLSPLVTVCGLPALATGLLHWRRTSRPDDAVSQTVGIGVGVAGAVVMAVAIGLAWPDPALLLPTTLTTAVLFALLAVVFEMSAAHLVTAACALVAWLVGFHVARGDGVGWQVEGGEELARALFSAASGNALVPLAGLFAGVAYAFNRVGRMVDALWYLVATAATVVVSLALAVGFGFARDGDPYGVTWTLSLYALAAAPAAVIARRKEVAWGAAALLLAALVQGVVFRYADVLELDQPWVVAMLGHATLVAIAGVAINRRDDAAKWTDALFQAGLATSVVAVGLLIAGLLSTGLLDDGAAGVTSHAMAAYLTWAAAVWLMLAVAANWSVLFAAFQMTLFLALASAVHGVVELRQWYIAAPRGWLDPWVIEAQGIALAAHCAIWTAARMLMWKLIAAGTTTIATLKRLGELLRVQTSYVDRYLEVVAVVLLLGVVVFGVAPGVEEEMAPTARVDRVASAIDRIETTVVAHTHATGSGAWLMLAAVTAMVTIGMWRDFVTVRVVALVVVAGLASGIVATWWETERATASALRWTMAGYALLVSAPIWARHHVQSLAARLGIAGAADGTPERSIRLTIDGWARATTIVVVMLAYTAMGVYVGSAALRQSGLPDGMHTTLYGLGSVCLMMLIAVAVLARIDRGGLLSATVSEARSQALAWASLVSQVLLMMALAPLVAAGIFVVADALRAYPIIGPADGSRFLDMGLSLSYGVPIVGIIVALLGHGVRERSSQYTVSAALLVNLVTTTVYLIERAAAGADLNGEAWVQLAQFNAIATALFSLAWLGVWTQYGSRATEDGEATKIATTRTATTPPSLLGTYIGFGAALCGAIVIWAGVYLSLYPAAATKVEVAGEGWGWLAVGLSGAGVVWLARRYNVRHTLVSLTIVLGVTAAMLAFTAARWGSGNWLAYHTLLAGCGVAAATAPTLARIWAGRKGWRLTSAGVGLATLFATVTVVLSLRALDGDPQAPWWTIGGLLAMALLSAVLAWEAAMRRFVWVSAALLNMAASIWWVDSGHELVAGGGSLRDMAHNFVYINMIALAVMAVYSVVVQRRRIDLREEADQRTFFDVGLHRVAVWGMLMVMLFSVAAGLIADIAGESPAGSKPLLAVAVVAVIASLVARLWDARSRFTVACLYLAGVLGMGAFLDGLDINNTSLLLMDVTLCAAAYALLTSYLWSRRIELTAWFARLGVPLAVDSHAQGPFDKPNWVDHTWLVATNGLVAVLVTAAVFWIECTFDSWTQRIAVAYALAALTFAMALLSRGTYRLPLQYMSLVWGVLFAVAFGFSWLAPGSEGPVLNRAIVAVVAIAVAAPLYGFGLVKLWRGENEWTRAAARLTPVLVTLGGVLLIVVLGLEVYHFMEHGDVPVRWAARIAVAMALVGTGVAAVAAAVVSGRDPLGLSEKGRTAYVYAAEIIATLFFIHVRVTVPWLFHGWFVRFWPLVAMAIAFAGVGFSEWCARRRQHVLARPLEKTAALLPILPVMGYWVVDNDANFSLLLLSVGALYAVLSVLRRSYGFSILAVVATNGSLWRLLGTHEGLGLAEHPQLWLIPPAVCVLVASYLNRDRLNGQQMTSIRYVAAIVIYAASTADIFLNGVAEAPWLPGVLALFAIAGVFAGIMLRVRAFLFLGTTFLIVSLMTIIWTAAVHIGHTSVWWVSGIVAGVLIIVLFGIFEKRRDDVLRVVDNLRHWDG